ncbi:unnamed protein product, partial [Mesorhabditis spiculigera]
MLLSYSNHEKISLRLERGARPAITFSEDRRKITVPLDTAQNWRPVKTELFNDLTVVLQRLQQQFKITVQAQNERKPEFTVYTSVAPHERELRTQVREVNTRLSELSISGPNMDVYGVLKAPKISLESTSGTMRIYARIESDRIRLTAPNLVVAPEALLSTNKLRMAGRKVQVDGRIFPSENGPIDEPRVMSIRADAQLFHIGVDGRIGEGNDKENLKNSRGSAQPQIMADGLLLQVSGSLANYGKILAIEKVDLAIGGSIVSLSDGSIDSATRGYDALKQIRGIGKAVECSPSSSSLQSAIQDQNANAVARLIEIGVDKNDKARSRRKTLRQTAIAKYREAKERSTQNNARSGLALINALLAVHDWRRGCIQANVIQANVGKNCEDCAQFNAEHLQIAADAAVEADSIWHCGHVEMDVGGKFEACGQIKHKTAVFNVSKQCTISAEAIVSHEVLCRLSAESVFCDGVWSSGDTVVIETLESLELACNGDCHVGGTLQLGAFWLTAHKNVVTTADGKVFVEGSSTMTGHSLLHSGIWTVGTNLDGQFKDSIECFHSSRLEAHIGSLACERHCTIGGIMNIEVNLCEGVVTAGVIRNNTTWHAEGSLAITAGSAEQSVDGMFFVKEVLDLTLHAHAKSIHGKIIANRASFRFLKAVQADAYIRVNEIDIGLPYADESQFTFGGQIDVLAGCLTLKGNSRLAQLPTSLPHPSPALLLGGKLNATAIIAPFLAGKPLKFICNTPHIDFNTLISAGALTTGKGCSIMSMGHSEVSEGIVCATTWAHSGQIRFETNQVNIHTGSLLYAGRLTSLPDKQNHVIDLQIVVDELLVNEGIISAHRLSISGDGRLDNRNRIFAVDDMAIRLANFNNNAGLMESKNSMKLLAVNKEWTRVSGTIKAKSQFQVCAQRLDLAVENVEQLCKSLNFSAVEELLISSDIIDTAREKNVACAAKKSVTVASQMCVNDLEILFGETDTHNDAALNQQFAIAPGSRVETNTVYVHGNASIVVLRIDGTLKCSSLRVAANIHRVLITGNGHLECGSLRVEGEALCIDLTKPAKLSEIICSQVEIPTIVQFVDRESVEIYPELSYLEIYGKDSVKTVDSLTLHGITTTTIESGHATLELDAAQCKSMLISGNEVSISGLVQGVPSSCLTATAASLTWNVATVAVETLELKGRRELNISEEISGCGIVSIDGKWTTLTGVIRDVQRLSLRAWALLNTGRMSVLEMSVNCLSIFLNGGLVKADTLKITAPFFVSVHEFSDVFAQRAQIHAVVCASNHQLANTSNADPSSSYLWLEFDEKCTTYGITEDEARSWKQTSAMLQDRFKSNSSDVDETVLALKYVAELPTARIELPENCEIFAALQQIYTRFVGYPIGLFSVSKFVSLVANLRPRIQLDKVVQSPVREDVQKKKKSKRKSMGCDLYEGLVQFKTNKYDRESRNSTETVDGGYVSRGSSEDLERKLSATPPLSPALDQIISAFSADHMTIVANRLDPAFYPGSPSAEQLNESFAVDEEAAELLEFEELELELEEEEAGVMRTDVVVCQDKLIRLAPLKQRLLPSRPVRSPPRMIPLERMPSSNDLVMKRLRVKHTLSSLDLRSYGSETSLNSVDLSQLATT